MKCLVEQVDQSDWDAFVHAHEEGTFFHLWKWREVLTQSFGYEPVYLAAENEGRLEGVLPLFLARSLVFGKGVVSIPLGVYGGPLASSSQVRLALVQKASVIARSHRARYLEIRGNPYNRTVASNGSGNWAVGFKQKDLYVTFIGEVDKDLTVNMSRIPRKQRRMIRVGEKSQLRFFEDNARLNDFYDIYAASVRNLGTPVYPYYYFENLAHCFGVQCKIFFVEHERNPVASVLTFFYKDQVLPYYAGSLRDLIQLAPNDFMYWSLMSYAAEHGYRIFDFGRSKVGTGSFDFKRHWGFEPRPLPYWSEAMNGREIPDTSPLNPKLQWAIRLWRKLPLSVTKSVGPRIARHLP